MILFEIYLFFFIYHLALFYHFYVKICREYINIGIKHIDLTADK